MAIISYTKTYFQSPPRISEDIYNSIKQEIARNPDFIIAEGETFTDHFKSQFKIMGICLLLFFLLMFMNIKDGNPLMLVIGLSALIFIYNLIYLFLEAPSFATYVKKREEYFSRMNTQLQIQILIVNS